MKLQVLAAPLLAVLAFAPAFAQGVDPFTGGNADAGATKAAVCAACHGPAGNSANPEWPKLAGQHASYVVQQLKMFKSGERKNPVMSPQAAGLSEQDMKDLAAYFAKQPAQPGVASPDSVKLAEPLFRAGDAKRGLPACAGCHGPKGVGNAAAAYPRIGGQHARYTATILRALRAAAGQGASQNLVTMSSVAARLSDAEIDALASYVNGLQ